MSTLTLAQAVEITGKSVFDYLDHEAEVPVVTKAAAQGDVSVLRVTLPAVSKPMPKMVTVVASEASSNTHTLHPSGDCFYEPNASSGPTDLVLGTLSVPEGSTAILSHQEHGALEIAPGTYHIGRQREFAGEWTMVRD